MNEGCSMRKAIFIVIAISLCLALVFGGCSRNAAEGHTQGNFCRVLCLLDDGIVVWIENIGHVYVKHVDAALEIKPLNTVVMEFSESDLQSASGKFTDFFGKEQSYSYILESPKSIRHTTEGEPTFG